MESEFGQIDFVESILRNLSSLQMSDDDDEYADENLFGSRHTYGQVPNYESRFRYPSLSTSGSATDSSGIGNTPEKSVAEWWNNEEISPNTTTNNNNNDAYNNMLFSVPSFDFENIPISAATRELQQMNRNIGAVQMRTPLGLRDINVITPPPVRGGLMYDDGTATRAMGQFHTQASFSTPARSISPGIPTINRAIHQHYPNQQQFGFQAKPDSNIRQQLRPMLKFGGFGQSNTHFLEPNGIVVSSEQDIVVADTNSHKIKLFDQNGNFKYKFGETGKAPGKMLYPCKIAMMPDQTNLVIVQRNPMPQVQIFKLNGQYQTRFGSSLLKSPRALCVDERGRIIIVESKIMVCHVFSPDGRRLHHFNLQNSLSFPYDVCAYQDEFYISDNQSHCIKVFDFNGNLVRRIGDDVVKFPVCVDVCTDKQSILVADNHERFNINKFTLSGVHENSFYSCTKHAQCYDICANDEGLVLSSKDFRVYGYHLPQNKSKIVNSYNGGGMLRTLV